MIRPVALAGLAATMVVACMSTPTPSATSAPAATVTGVVSPSASASAPTQNEPVVLTPAPIPAVTRAPRPDAWPQAIGSTEPVFGPDGTVYFVALDALAAHRGRLVALDTAGHPRAGWPFAASPGSDLQALAVGPDGSVYVQERGAVRSSLHRLDGAGRELAGWPFELPQDLSAFLAIARNGVAYVMPNGAPVSPRIIAIGPSGSVLDGWPIDLDSQEWSDLRAGADGTLFLIRRPPGTPTTDLVRGIVDDDAVMWAFGPKGQPQSGWPVPVANIRGYLTGPGGDVVVRSLIDDIGELCPSPRRTVLTVLGPDGRTRPGWPRGSTGFASPPVVGADGTVYYVSATDKVYAHDRSGEVKAGWPISVPGAHSGCGAESPHLAPDDLIYVIGDEVTALSPDGRAPAGWPYRPSGKLVGPCLDSECYGGHAGPTFGPDGTVYLIEYRTETAGVRADVVALDRQGRLRPGWPVRLPFDPASVGVSLMTTSPDGRLYVRGGDALMALDPARISR